MGLKRKYFYIIRFIIQNDGSLDGCIWLTEAQADMMLLKAKEDVLLMNYREQWAEEAERDRDMVAAAIFCFCTLFSIMKHLFILIEYDIMIITEQCLH